MNIWSDVDAKTLASQLNPVGPDLVEASPYIVMDVKAGKCM